MDMGTKQGGERGREILPNRHRRAQDQYWSSGDALVTRRPSSLVAYHSLLRPTMVSRFSSLIFLFSLPVLVLSATNASNSDTFTCNPAHNGLATGTLQFASDCNVTTWCNNGECQRKGCRRDEFPLGYDTGGSRGNGKHIPPPPLCPASEFCPDEGSQCVPQIAVGQPCQFDRDGSLFYPVRPYLFIKLFRFLPTSS